MPITLLENENVGFDMARVGESVPTYMGHSCTESFLLHSSNFQTTN